MKKRATASASKLTQQEQYDLSQIRQVKSRLIAKPIGGIVRRLVSNRGYAAEQAHRLTQQQWQAAAGLELGQRSRAGTVNRRILYVEVSDSIVLQELHFRKQAILKSLQAALPEFKIKDVRFRVVTM